MDIPSSIGKRLMFWVGIVLGVAIAGLFLLSFTSKQPDNLGLDANGMLAKCPESPNCVSTQTADKDHHMESIEFDAESNVRMKIIRIAEGMGGVLEADEGCYLRFEFTSSIFRFVDDVEFLIDHAASRIQFRSASRVGRSDLGANRRRMERFVALFSND